MILLQGVLEGAYKPTLRVISVIRVIPACTAEGSSCTTFTTSQQEGLGTLIKKKKCFLIYKEIQSGSGAKSYMRKGFIIYEEMRKYLVIYGEAVSHI